MKKANMLFITKNTHKGIFGILENCWVYQQKCWVPQATLGSLGQTELKGFTWLVKYDV